MLLGGNQGLFLSGRSRRRSNQLRCEGQSRRGRQAFGVLGQRGVRVRQHQVSEGDGVLRRQAWCPTGAWPVGPRKSDSMPCHPAFNRPQAAAERAGRLHLGAARRRWRPHGGYESPQMGEGSCRILPCRRFFCTPLQNAKCVTTCATETETSASGQRRPSHRTRRTPACGKRQGCCPRELSLHHETVPVRLHDAWTRS